MLRGDPNRVEKTGGVQGYAGQSGLSPEAEFHDVGLNPRMQESVTMPRRTDRLHSFDRPYPLLKPPASHL